MFELTKGLQPFEDGCFPFFYMKLKLMMMKGILLFVLMISLSGLHAQTGEVQGKITDAETGEELIGASVIVEGTTMGVSSDLDGNYRLENLQPGTYTFICQYISFQTQKIPDVEIKAGETVSLSFALQPVSMGLQEVVVSAKAVHRSEVALLTVQKKSSSVIEGLSAEQMRKSGDSDAASALKRLAGVTVTNGRYIFVRGLSDRYSKTTLNGAEIPGLDPNRNTVQMDLFPANLLENIIIYKSFSPELPADFTGGLIDIRTREFPEQFMLGAKLTLGYNSQASLNNNFLGYPGSSTDRLGFDNGLRKIPSSAGGEIPVYPSNKQALTDITMDFNKIMAPVKSKTFLNKKLSFSFGDNKTIGKRQLGYVFGASYKAENLYYENGIKGRYKLNGVNDNNLNTEHLYDDTQGTSRVLWGVLLNLSLKISDRHKISLNLFKNQSGTSLARYMVGAKQSDDLEGLYVETRKLQWLERSLNTVQLRGEHDFEQLTRLHFDWTAAATSSYQDEPDMRFFTNSYYPGNNEKNQYAIEPSLYKFPARYFRYLKETSYNLKANFSLKLSENKKAPKLKFGGAYLYKKRDFSDKRIDYKFQFPQNTYNGNVPDFLSDENIGLNFSGYDPATGMNYGLYVQGNPGDDLKNSYTADQQVTAAYALIDAQLGVKLRVVAGLRYEHTLINSASKDSSLAKGYLNNHDLLPALNLTLALNEKMNLRFNLSRTIARPTFRELAPYASEDFSGGEIYVGNASLKRTSINNIGMRWEWYSRPGEIFSAGLFYKMFTNPIELVDNPKAQNPELKWDNVERADVYGFELDFRKRLDFWNFSRNLQFGLNFSYIYSSVDIDSVELTAIRATDPGALSTRPMTEQSPYIVNSFLGYKSEKAGFDVSLVYNVTGPKILINVKGGTPDIYAQPFHSLNVVANKAFGEHFIVGLKFKNLLDQTYSELYTFKGRDYIYRQFKPGMLFELSLNYEF